MEEIFEYENELEGLKRELKQTPKHITIKEMEEEDRFRRLLPGRKRLLDTVRMVAYRSETAIAGLLVDTVVNLSDARGILQDLFTTDADILPDVENKVLRVRIHNASRPVTNRVLFKLLDELNSAEVLYSGTDLRLVYELVGYGS